MITIPAGVHIYLACGVTDMRNYVESVIMRSSWRQVIASHGIFARFTQHNPACAEPCSASPAACRARGSGRVSTLAAPWQRALRVSRMDRRAGRPRCFANWHGQAIATLF